MENKTVRIDASGADASLTSYKRVETTLWDMPCFVPRDLDASSGIMWATGDSAIMELDEFYTFRNLPNARSFLLSHPDVVELLREARPHLEECFGPQVDVMLAVIQEPREMDRMFAYIRTSLSAEEALAQLDHLDESWFLSRVGQVGAFFNFNLEFHEL